MEDDYYSRRSVHDSAMIAGGCFVAIVVLGTVAFLVQVVRWVLA